MTQPFSSDNQAIQQQTIPQATVIVGTVSLDDNSGKFDSGVVPDCYTDVVMLNRYENDKHIYMGGITDPNGFQGASVAFVQLCSPTTLWVCDWTISSFREQPASPDPKASNQDWILMDEHWEPRHLLISPDGSTQLYRISGTFVYGHKNPNVDPHKDIAFPRPPWLQDVFDRSMPASKLKRGLTEGGAMSSPAPAQTGTKGSTISPAQQVGGTKG